MEEIPKERHKFVIEETKRISKQMTGESIGNNNIIIDYLACFDWTLGRTPDEKTLEKLEVKEKFIIYDYFFANYADEDLVLALIVHECCRLVHGRGCTEKHQELFNKYCQGDFSIEKHQKYNSFLKRLEEKNLFKNNKWINTPTMPLYEITKKLLEI